MKVIGDEKDYFLCIVCKNNLTFNLDKICDDCWTPVNSDERVLALMHEKKEV